MMIVILCTATLLLMIVARSRASEKRAALQTVPVKAQKGRRSS